MSKLQKIKARARALASLRPHGVLELVDDVFKEATQEAENNAFNTSPADTIDDALAIIDDWITTGVQWSQTPDYGEATTTSAQAVVSQALKAFGESTGLLAGDKS